MSPLSRERLLVGLAPSDITLVRMRGRLRPRIVAKQRLALDLAGEGEAWRAPVAALRAALAGMAARARDATVVLSNHFVRYALLPWNEALRGSDEEQAYARHHFVRIYGERAKSWGLRASPAPSGAPRLASAIDAALAEALADSFPEAGGLRLVSLQPYLMAAFNRWRSEFPPTGAWLLLLEPGRACLGLHTAGRWRAVRSTRGSFDSPDELVALLERERHHLQGEIPDLVLLHAARAAGDPPQAPGWRLQPLPLTEGRYGPALTAA